MSSIYFNGQFLTKSDEDLQIILNIFMDWAKQKGKHRICQTDQGFATLLTNLFLDRQPEWSDEEYRQAGLVSINQRLNDPAYSLEKKEEGDFLVFNPVI
ncbi:hypothetical protein [Tellurirhabdus rosea]|uniref:hypothetical protein n=1 Tax=Tellurirhabdus rosea TaxID=2674997 RepID=UPI00224EFCF1|nr:hypothetical protein [Tellurirhabdus rosea]